MAHDDAPRRQRGARSAAVPRFASRNTPGWRSDAWTRAPRNGEGVYVEKTCYASQYGGGRPHAGMFLALLLASSSGSDISGSSSGFFFFWVVGCFFPHFSGLKRRPSLPASGDGDDSSSG